MPESTTQKQHGPGRPFEKGHSGNPAGRPKGARHKTTLAVEALLQGQANAIAQTVVQMALAGDAQMLKAILDRVCPVRKDSPMTMDLPDISDATKLPEATARIVAAVSTGVITPNEGQALVSLSRKPPQGVGAI